MRRLFVAIVSSRWFAQVPRDREGGGARVEHDDRAVWDEGGGELGDALLLLGLHVQSHIESAVGARGRRGAHRAAVGAYEHALGIELVEVAADGVDRDAVALSQRGHRHLPAGGDEVGQIGTAPCGQMSQEVPR